MEAHYVDAIDDLEAVMGADSWARQTARDLLQKVHSEV
jgi:hypothetical protein